MGKSYYHKYDKIVAIYAKNTGENTYYTILHEPTGQMVKNKQKFYAMFFQNVNAGDPRTTHIHKGETVKGAMHGRRIDFTDLPDYWRETLKSFFN